MMFTSVRLICALIFAIANSTTAIANSKTANANERMLSDDDWRADITEMVETVTANHPNPFRHNSEEAFNAAIDKLNSEIPELSDKEIIVEMAKIIALINDGHTRLSIPREHNELGFSFSHSEPKQPEFSEMNFKSLPLRMRVFEGKLFIVETVPALKDYIGAEVVAFGETPATEAMTRLSAVNYNDNEATDILLTADRAALPEVLVALGITADADKTTLTLRRLGETKTNTIVLAPLGPDAAALITSEAATSALWLRDSVSPKWAHRLRKDKTHYIQLNQIEGGAPELFLAEFMKNEVANAKQARAKKIVLDLRHNHGGSGGYSRAVVNAIVDSPYNRYGKFFVLTGRETFSAAGHLLTELEKYTDGLLFGEITSASPDSYGDPKRIQLKNSGLDLRVSRLHWGSWRAFETRNTYTPHFPVPYSIDDYVNGRDPVLDAALQYTAPAKLPALIAEVAANDENWDGVFNMFSRLSTDHRAQPIDISELASGLMTEAEQLERSKDYVPALFLFDIARQIDGALVDAYLGWARSALALDDKGEAENAINAGLEAFPENAELLALRIHVE